MSQARIIPLTPRIVDQTRLAAYLGKSDGWLRSHLPVLLQDHGFPAKIELLGGWDVRDVDAWIDRRGEAIAKPSGRVMNAFR